MIKLEIVPKKLLLAKERIAELSNIESRLTASGDIDVKCPDMKTSGDQSTVSPEIFL